MSNIFQRLLRAIPVKILLELQDFGGLCQIRRPEVLRVWRAMRRKLC